MTVWENINCNNMANNQETLWSKIKQRRYRLYQDCMSLGCWFIILIIILGVGLTWFWIYGARKTEITALPKNFPYEFPLWQNGGYQRIVYLSGAKSNRDAEIYLWPDKIINNLWPVSNFSLPKMIKDLTTSNFDHSLDMVEIYWNKSNCDIENIIADYQKVLLRFGYYSSLTGAYGYNQGITYNRGHLTGNIFFEQVPGEIFCLVKQTINYKNQQ